MTTKRRSGSGLMAVALISVLSACAPTEAPEATAAAASMVAAEAPALVVFAVRHAERVDQSADAALSATGIERAQVLAMTLSLADIGVVHSSDYTRTRETAAPIAAALGLEVELYDPRDLPALIQNLRASGGRHLVVGHSNTTPEVAALLGGEPGTPIDDSGEFDRLYVVTIGPDHHTSTAILRYGAPYRPEGTP